MRIGRWSKLSTDRVCQEHEVMRDADANETVGVTRGCVTVEDTIVRSYDCVGHSSSCYTYQSSVS